MRSRNRQLLPYPNDSYVQVPGRQGSVHFPRELNDRHIDLDCAFVEANLPNLRTRAREIAAWLYTQGREILSFDDEPGKHYKGKLLLSVDFSHLATMGEFRITFLCEPLAYGELVSTNFANDAATVTNAGTYQAQAIIEATFTGATSEFKVTCGTEYIRVVNNFVLNDTLKIDTGTGAILINGQRAMDKLDWQNSIFFDLAVGENTLSITPTGKCTATVKHTPRWV